MESYTPHSTRAACAADNGDMDILGVILARAGSKGLPDKCVRPLLGRPMIEYTFDHALAARSLTAIVLSTDSRPAMRLARARGIELIERPAALAGDTATVDESLRHAVLEWESRHGRSAGAVVMLYGNIPVRAAEAIDRCVWKLREAGTSVRTVAPIGKHHPDWLHRLAGDRMSQFRTNSIYRRQDLEPLYYHDGAVIAVTRAALFAATPGDAQSFLGDDRRALVQRPDDAVDVDDAMDLAVAEAVLRGARPSAPAAIDAPHVRRIGSRDVGPNRRVYVIAEAGVNHDGDFDDALRLVDVAADTGADAVKFQIFESAKLTRRDAPMAAYQRAAGGESQREMLAKLELNTAQFERLATHARTRGIDFLATPFGIDDLGVLRRLGVAAVKFASTDLNNVTLLQPATALGLPMILSTGASTAAEIDAAVARLREWRVSDRAILLHCVSAYPTPPAAANVRAIAALSARTGLPVGYSDHTTLASTGALAVAAGACVLEKHFTLDRLRPGPDHAMSLSPGELAEYIARVREAESLLGSGQIGMSAIERDVRAVARKSLCYARPLTVGTRITSDMLIAKRPGDGIGPDQVERVVGRELIANVEPDSPVAWEHLR